VVVVGKMAVLVRMVFLVVVAVAVAVAFVAIAVVGIVKVMIFCHWVLLGPRGRRWRI
jgi:hypothetical protein